VQADVLVVLFWHYSWFAEFLLCKLHEVIDCGINFFFVDLAQGEGIVALFSSVTYKPLYHL